LLVIFIKKVIFSEIIIESKELNMGMSFLLLIIVAILMFMGLRTALYKSFYVPDDARPQSSSKMLKDQKTRIKEVRKRQKKLMEDQRQKLKDAQRK